MPDTLKRVTAYVNTTRVHWLVESLIGAGVEEIMVTEYFKPQSQISRLELLCAAPALAGVREIVNRLGGIDHTPDHIVIVADFDPSLADSAPFGLRMGRLDA